MALISVLGQLGSLNPKACSRTHRFVVTIRVLTSCLGTLAIAETGGICLLSQDKSDDILPYSMLNAIVKWGNDIIYSFI